MVIFPSMSVYPNAKKHRETHRHWQKSVETKDCKDFYGILQKSVVTFVCKDFPGIVEKKD